MELLVFTIVGGAVLAVVAMQASKRQRRQDLIAKYGDATIADLILAHRIWQGMSHEQLVDSLGDPVAIDHRVFKTKEAATYKYNQTGRNRFRCRVKLENGIVVGWEQK